VHPTTVNRASLAPVTTILTPAERVRVDAAGEGLYTAMHRDSIDDVIRDVKELRASAVLVSVTRCGPRDAPRVAMLVREFPRVPTVALLTEVESNAPTSVLTLGRSGVQTLVDVRQPAGWRVLRDVLLADQSRDVSRLALAQLSADLVGAQGRDLGIGEALDLGHGEAVDLRRRQGRELRRRHARDLGDGQVGDLGRR